MAPIKNYNALELIGLTLIVSAVFLFRIASVAFVGDESMWISRSYYFELFLSGRFRDIVHDPSPSISMAMPTMPEYLIGFSRWLGGYHPADLNQIYSFEENYAQNVEEGKVPSDGLLWWSRFLPSLMSAASVLLLFYLVKASMNRLAGYLWLLLALGNSYLTNTLQEAMSEASLVLALLLACFAGYRAMKALHLGVPGRTRSLIWLALFGVFTGLAGQSKNNGLSIFLAGIFIVILLSIRVEADRWSKLKFLAIGLVLLSLTTFLFFVGPNPLLWKHPIKTSLQLIPFRLALMQRQAFTDPGAVIHGWQGWIAIVPAQIFANLTPVNLVGMPYLKFLIACLGLWLLTIGVWRALRDGKIPAAAIALLTVSITASIPPLFTTLNWARYYVLPVIFVSVFISVGAAFLLRSILELLGRKARAAPSVDGGAGGASPPA